MSGIVYLVASGHDGLLQKVARRAYETLGKKRPRIAVTYAPVGDDARLLAFMRDRMPGLFPDGVLETIEEDPSALERADLVFVSGGDPTLGAKVLADAGSGDRIRAAMARGTPTVGVSAGSILLGDWWADWPDDEVEGEELVARTSLVRCTGVVAGHVFDTHNEEDDWDELRIVAALARREGHRARFLGIPTGGALVFGADGALEVIGAAPFELR
jgi:hypothetical protein